MTNLVHIVDREERAVAGPSRTAEELAVEAQGGSTSSFSELVERFHRPLLQFLFVRTGSSCAAEELTQEAFLRAWTKLHLYDPKRRFSTWLFTLAKHLAVSRARKRGHEKDHALGSDSLDELASETAEDPSRLAGLREEGQRVWDVARRILPAEQRSALWLRYAEDLSIEDISRILGRQRVTVRVLLHRARERLARHLAPAEAPGSKTPGLSEGAGTPSLIEGGGGLS